jgi:hypothetical protein
MPANQLRICAPFSAMTGYSKMARAALRMALLAGFEVEAIESDSLVRSTQYADGRVSFEKIPPKRLIPIPECQDAEWLKASQTVVSPEAPTLLIQLPHNLFIWPQFQHGPVIGWTMTESDNLCHAWKHGGRCTDLLLAPSTYCLDTFRRVLPEVQSAIMPIPVDERLWDPDEYVDRPAGAPPFLFLFIFATSERKNWRITIQGFAEEFCEEREAVGLVTKPTDGAGVGTLIGGCQQMGAWISMDGEKRTDWTLAAIYRACDVIVQASSEGFGLPYIEGAMLGKPSVALSLGGAADVVSEDTGYIVPNCTMAPLIGHMPATYPRADHSFASCDIDSLRATLRRAYEEESAGFGKGKVARERALQRFTPQALADQFRQRMEEGVEAHNRHSYTVAVKRAPKWACAFGAWGDVFAACGKIRKVMAEWELEKIGVIFYGSDKRIAEWLRLQPWVRDVISIVEPDKKVMTKHFGMACQCKPIHARTWLRQTLMENGLLEFGCMDDVGLTQLRLNEKEMPTYWHDPRLSEEAMQWARERAEEIGKPFYLLNPLSIASNKMRDHWRYWSDAMQWLLDRTDETYALVSEKPIEWPEHPRLVNLSGQSRTMQDVLALAELSQGAISTSNNLGIYAPIAGIPCVIVCARTCGRETFYHRWMEIEGIRLLDFEDAMPQFVAAVEDLLRGGSDHDSVAGKNRHGTAEPAGQPFVSERGGARERETSAIG